MKLFKRIYYPVLVALLVVVLALSFVDASMGSGGKSIDSSLVMGHVKELSSASHNSINPSAQEKVRNYIVKYLTDNGATRVYGSVDGTTNENLAEFAVDADGKPKPTVVVQTATLWEETIRKIDSVKDNENIVAKIVNNIVTVIPGKGTIAGNKSDAIVLFAHYDSVPQGGGASDNAMAVANMMENFKFYVNAQLENDVVLVFTDMEEEGMYGAYAFMEQMTAFKDVVSRIKFGANFDSRGNEGSLIMFQSSKNNVNVIKEYAKINGSVFASSVADYVYSIMNNFTDFSAFTDFAALNFANIGGGQVYHSSSDSYANVNESVVAQQGEAMNRVIKTFGGMNLDTLKSDSSAVFFTYLDVAFVWYPIFVAFLIAAIILGLVIAIIILNRKRKAFSLVNMGKGVGVQLLTIAATVLTLLVASLLIQLLLVGFGVFTFETIGSLSYASTGLTISVMLLTIGIASAFYSLFKKIFLTKASDVVRGNVAIWTILALVLSFALPQVSYLFAILAVLELVAVLMTVLFKEKFRAKFGMDIERLFLPLGALIIALPLLIPVISLATNALSVAMYPVIMSVFVLMIGFIAPYFDYLTPVLDKLMLKLPKRTIRVEREVTERLEDKAKKGKFSVVTSVKVQNEKINWRYKSRLGVSIVTLVSVVMIMCFSSFGANYSDNISGSSGFNNAVYDNALVYVWDQDESSVTTRWEVTDKIAYKHISKAVEDLKWDDSLKAYTKVDYDNKVLIGSQNAPTISKIGKIYLFTSHSGDNSTITLTIKNTAAVEKFTFKADKFKASVHTNPEGLDEMVFRLPYAYGGFTMEVDGGSTLDISYEEHILGNILQNYTEYMNLTRYFQGKQEASEIRGGLVLRMKKSL